MILSLGASGAPSLHFVGPQGTHAFLTSTASFAKRKYPVLTCSEIDSVSSRLQSSHVELKHCSSNVVLVDDPFVRVTPLSVKYRHVSCMPPHASCCLCRTTQSKTPVRADTASVCVALARSPKLLQSKTEVKFDSWLTRFYQAKDPSKVPYVSVIRNKYIGRQDDLRRMLEQKYGSFVDVAVSSNSSSDEVLCSRIPRSKYFMMFVVLVNR
jgi:hypothetical protein